MKRNYFVIQTKAEGKCSAMVLDLPPFMDIIAFCKTHNTNAECMYAFRSKKEAEAFCNGCSAAYERGYNRLI